MSTTDSNAQYNSVVAQDRPLSRVTHLSFDYPDLKDAPQEWRDAVKAQQKPRRHRSGPSYRQLKDKIDSMQRTIDAMASQMLSVVESSKDRGRQIDELEAENKRLKLRLQDREGELSRLREEVAAAHPFIQEAADHMLKLRDIVQISELADKTTLVQLLTALELSWKIPH